MKRNFETSSWRWILTVNAEADGKPYICPFSLWTEYHCPRGTDTIAYQIPEHKLIIDFQIKEWKQEQ